MRDQMDAQLWNAHHDQFSEWMEGAIAAAAASLLRRAAAARQVPEQLFAALASVSLTLLTFTASAA